MDAFIGITFKRSGLTLTEGFKRSVCKKGKKAF
jgi:hypothetical protein